MADEHNSVLDKLKEKFDVVNANPATKLYLNKLKSIMVPQVIDSFKGMYKDIESNHENTNTLKSFQIAMKEIPHWNQLRIDEECNKIKEKCDWIHDLITGVFVVCVKIMTSVKISNQEKDYELVAPEFQRFVHLLYTKCAKDLFTNPYLMKQYEHDPEKNLKGSRKFKDLVKAAIDDTVNDLLPTQEILQQYIYETPEVEVVEPTTDDTSANNEPVETFAEGEGDDSNEGENDDSDNHDVDNDDEQRVRFDGVDEGDNHNDNHSQGDHGDEQVVDMSPHRDAKPASPRRDTYTDRVRPQDEGDIFSDLED